MDGSWWKKALPTGCPLKERGFENLGACPFGCDDEENYRHLFWNCQLKTAAWFGSNLAIKIDLLPFFLCGRLVQDSHNGC